MSFKKEEWLSLDDICKQLQCQKGEALRLIRRGKLETERPELFKKTTDTKIRFETKILYSSHILPIMAEVRRGKSALRPKDWLAQKQIYDVLEINRYGGVEYSVRALSFLMTITRQELGKEYQEKETGQFSDPITGKVELCFSPAMVSVLRTILKRSTAIPPDWIDWEELRLKGFSEKLIKKTQKVLPEEWDKKILKQDNRWWPTRVYSQEFIKAMQVTSLQ